MRFFVREFFFCGVSSVEWRKFCVFYFLVCFDLVRFVVRVDSVSIIVIGWVDTVGTMCTVGFVGIVGLVVRVDLVGIVGRVDIVDIVVRVDFIGSYYFFLFRIDSINFIIFWLLIALFNLIFFSLVIVDVFDVLFILVFKKKVFSFFVVVGSVKLLWSRVFIRSKLSSEY